MSDRVLDIQEDSGIIKPLSSLSTQAFYQIALSPDDKILLLTSKYNITRINMENLRSPAILDTIDLDLQGQLDDVWFSPNRQAILYKNNASILFTANLSNAQHPIQIDFQQSKWHDFLAVFFPDNTNGLLYTQHGLYQFNTSSSKVQHLLNFTDDTESFLDISTDGKLAFLNLESVSTDRSTLYIIDVSDLENVTTISNYTTNYDTDLLTVSSSRKILFITGVKRNKCFLEAVNITVPESPINIFQREVYSDPDDYEVNTIGMILSPDGNTLIIMMYEGSLVIDVSNLADLNIYNVDLSTAVCSTFSSDGRIILCADLDNLYIDELWANVDLDYQFNSPNPQITVVPTNGSAKGVTLSVDGKKAFVACDEGLEIFEINNQTTLTHQNLIITGYPAGQVVLAHDDKIAFMKTIDGFGIVDVIAQQEISNLTGFDSYKLTILPDENSNCHNL